LGKPLQFDLGGCSSATILEALVSGVISFSEQLEANTARRRNENRVFITDDRFCAACVGSRSSRGNENLHFPWFGGNTFKKMLLF
jgi:hypothetical protein